MARNTAQKVVAYPLNESSAGNSDSQSSVGKRVIAVSELTLNPK